MPAQRSYALEIDPGSRPRADGSKRRSAAAYLNNLSAAVGVGVGVGSGCVGDGVGDGVGVGVWLGVGVGVGVGAPTRKGVGPATIWKRLEGGVSSIGAVWTRTSPVHTPGIVKQCRLATPVNTFAAVPWPSSAMSWGCQFPLGSLNHATWIFGSELETLQFCCATDTVMPVLRDMNAGGASPHPAALTLAAPAKTRWSMAILAINHVACAREGLPLRTVMEAFIRP